MEFNGETIAQSPVRGKRVLGWLFVVALFFLYSFLAIRAPAGVFNSPDEMANNYFAGRVDVASTLKTFEPLETVGRGLVHPRAVSVVGNFLVPQSFHGLPALYGMIAHFVGFSVVPFLTPLFAVLAICAWSRIMARVSGESAGRYSAVVLAIIPAWWYYANRGLYHNILFTACLVFGTFFFVVKPFHSRWRKASHVINAFMAGLCISLALWVRTAEIIWVAVVVCFLLIVFRKKISWTEVISFLFGVTIGCLPIFFINHELYGHALSIGYTPPNLNPSVLPEVVREAVSNQSHRFGVLLQRFLSLAVPFGIHPRTALQNFFHYFLELPWAMAIAFCTSFLWIAYQHLIGRRTYAQTILMVVFLFVTGWLVTVYGSWVIHDNPDPTKITIGISYSRYWLPAFVLASGIAGGAFAVWAQQVWRCSLRIGGIGLLFLLAFFSFNTVFLSEGDGLVAIQKTLGVYASTKKDVMKRTPENAVIVVDRSDKIFFPERAVMTPLRDESTYAALRPLSIRAPLYYYGITLTAIDLRYQNQERLKPLGLRLELISSYGNESLYRFLILD